MAKTYVQKNIDKEMGREIDKMKLILEKMLGRPVSDPIASKFLMRKWQRGKKKEKLDSEIEFDFKI